MSEEAKTFTADEVRKMLREACNAAGNARKWARSRGVSEAQVSFCLHGQHQIGNKMARALGLRRTWVLDKEKTHV